MHITNEMIDPELRDRGRQMRRFMNGRRSKVSIKIGIFFMRTFLKGNKIKGLTCRDEYITRPDGSDMRVVVVSDGVSVGKPAILWLHGGGYYQGMPETSFISAMPKIVKRTGCVAVVPDYTLSIDKPYPAAVDDCYCALLWMRDNAERLHANPERLFVGGESAGGGLTAATCLMARDRGQVSVEFQMPLYPMLDDRMITPSAQNNDAPCWNSKLNEQAWEIYLKGLKGEVPYYAAPARADGLSGMPPAVTFVGDLEPFADETREYIRKLEDAGIATQFRVFEGCFHAFDMMCPEAKVSKEAVDFLCAAVKRQVLEVKQAT